MIKYMTGGWATDGFIVEVEAEKETDKSIWIKGSRSIKMSEYRQYHDTWADAKVFLLERAERKLNSARRALENAQGFYGNVKGLKQ